MTEDEVRAAAERLVQFHERFAPLFGKEQAQDHAYTYVKGLMICPERKSIEPIALNVGDGQVSALQKFINIAPWGHDDVQAESKPSSPTSWCRPRRQPDRSGWGDRRERLRQEGRPQRRRGTAVQRPLGQAGQLPGRRLPGGRHPRRLGPAGPSTLPARGLVRRDPGVSGPSREGPHPRVGRASRPSLRSPPG